MRERTQFQQAAEFSIFLSACLAGVLSVPAVFSVIGLSVLLLVVSDRGQHRALMDRFQSLPKDWILTLSFGSHIALNMLALAAAYGVGWLLKRGFQFVVLGPVAAMNLRNVRSNALAPATVTRVGRDRSWGARSRSWGAIGRGPAGPLEALY